MALQRRNSMASEENMSRGPSGLPLVKCPRCGSPVVECKSWRQGGRVVFKCEKNEQYVLEACSFFKWYDSYQRMLEGMELDITEEVPVPVARAAGGEGDMVDEGKIDKLSKWIQLLVLMNIGQGLLVLFDLLLGSGTMAGWDLAPGFSAFFLGEDLVGVPATGAVFLGDLLAGLAGWELGLGLGSSDG
uniref:Uncharacterized protein n=1 Tax=Oryza punctata TaxID=4537 RepID=A0A0E0LAQ1_ORYPU